LLTSFLHKLDPEKAHRLAIRGLSLGLVRHRPRDLSPRLKTTIAGLDLPNPLGLAAGFDKNAEALLGLQKIGFGWLEVGTITPRPQTGNPKPRIFRLSADRALINRLGFNNAGLEAAKIRLSRRRNDGLIGANIGANRDAEDPVSDYATCLDALFGHANYFTINVSSPNTPGLRDLQGRERLTRLLATLLDRREKLSKGSGSKKPLFLKIAPDLTSEDEDDISDVALKEGIDGLIIANTTIDRPESLTSPAKTEQGGLSGRPVLAPSTRQIGRFFDRIGDRLPLIGVGGIEDADSAYAKIRAGASALQLYTGFIYQGPAIIGTVLQGLDRLLKRDGFGSITTAIGLDRSKNSD